MPVGAADDMRPELIRLTGLLLAAPLALGALGAPFTAQQFEFPVVLAAICALIALSWGLVVLMAMTGRDRIVGAVALGLGACAVALVTACAGGLGSPAALVIAALPLEAWWVRRSRRALQIGALTAGSALGVLAGFGFVGNLPDVASAGWHWMLPAGYLLSLLPRLGHFAPAGRAAAPRDADLERLSDCAVLHIDDAGEVTGGSARAAEVLGLPITHLAGGGLFERVHVADRVLYKSALSDLRETGETMTVGVRIRVPEGETCSQTRLYAVTFGRKADGTAVLMLRDRQEMVELERRARIATERADRLDVTKNRFLGAVSHELRTPLNAIIGFSDMMLQGMAGPFADARQTEYVGIVRESGQHLLSVVNSILDVSKIEAGTYTICAEPFRFAEAVEFCRSMMVVQAQAKRIALRVQIERNVGEIVGDRRAVQQTLINLVANAIKFTPDGGSVTIGAHRQGGRLQFWISDTGIGIAAADLDQLGQPFTQIHNDYTRQSDGAGLGLSIVKGLVALHRGSLSVASAPGEGTTVTVTLPVDGAEQPVKFETSLTHAPQNPAETIRRIA